MRFLICLLLLTGCNEARLVEISSELEELELRLFAAEGHARWLEDEQDDIADDVSDLVDGQKLIELQEPEPCQKCFPVEDFPPILMGPQLPGVAPR